MDTSAAALVVILAILVTAGAGVLLHQRAVRGLIEKLDKACDERLVRDQSALMIAHKATVDSMQAASDQMFRTGAGYVDRLRTDVARLKQQRAEDHVAHELIVQELKERIAVLENEVDVLRRMIRRQDGPAT